MSRQNYAAKRESRKQDVSAAGLLSERFPEVADIVLKMTYYRTGAASVLMVRTVNFSPSSNAYFKMDCMTKDCDTGGFDFTSVISGMVRARKKAGTGALSCGGGAIAASEHARIEYKVQIAYIKG